MINSTVLLLKARGCPASAGFSYFFFFFIWGGGGAAKVQSKDVEMLYNGARPFLSTSEGKGARVELFFHDFLDFFGFSL